MIANKQRAVLEARTARVRLGAGLDAPLPDILRLIEDVGDVPVTVRALPEGIAGAYGKKKGRAFIFVNSNDSPVRRRFTLAHEFGHHCLGHAGVFDLQVDVGGKTNKPEEIEANYFASEFLAPVQAVRSWAEARGLNDVDLRAVVELAHYFRVSPKAARIRFEEAGLLTRPGERRELDAEIKADEHLRLRAYLQLEDVEDSLATSRIARGSERLPQQAFRRAARAYEVGLAAPDRLASYLGQKRRVFEERVASMGISPRLPDDEDD